MTLTNVLPDPVATDVLSRRMPDNSGGSGGGDQGGAFPELLGRLAVLQSAEQRASLPATAAGDGPALATEPQPSLPWQLRVNDGLALHSGEIVLRAHAQTSDPLGAVLAQDGKPVGAEASGKIAALASELLAEQASGDGKYEGVEEVSVAPSDEKAQATHVTTATPPGQNGADPTAIMTGSEAAMLLLEAKLSTKVTSAQSADVFRDAATALRARAEIAGPTAGLSTGDQSAPLPQSVTDVGLSAELPPVHDGEHEAAPLAVQETTKITVLRTETHLPPTGPALPMQQIGEHIGAALGDVSEVNGSHSIETPKGMPAAPVKVLQIQLQPVELGTVTVRMSLKRDGLEVQLDVARQETAQLLRRDHEVIFKALQSAGYLLDGVTVQVVEADRSTPAQFGGQSQNGNAQSPMQSQPDWSRSDGHSPDTQRQAGQESRRQGQPEPGPSTLGDAGGPRAANGGVYL